MICYDTSRKDTKEFGEPESVRVKFETMPGTDGNGKNEFIRRESPEPVSKAQAAVPVRLKKNTEKYCGMRISSADKQVLQ